MTDISESDKIKVINQKCTKHGKKLLLLYIGNKNGLRRMCFKCIQEDNIPIKQIVEIEDILSFDPSKSSLILESFENKKISSMLVQMNTQDKQMRCQIKEFFKKFQQDINSEVEKIIIKSSLSADSFSRAISESSAHQREINRVSRLQKILIAQKPTQEQELQQCISEWNSFTQTNDLNNLEKAQQIYSSFSTQSAEKISKDILLLISYMNLFQSDSMPNFPLTFSNIPSKVDHDSELKATQLKNSISQDIKPMNPLNCLPVNVKQNPSNSLSSQDEKKNCSTIQLSKYSFIPSVNYQDSSKIKIEFNNNNNSINIFNTNDFGQQCYFNQLLSKSSNYIIQLTYNHTEYKKPASFAYGLVSQENKDDDWPDDIYYNQIAGGNTNKMIKGNNLKSGYDAYATGLHKYEIHLNISEKLFRVCSLDYQNCQELDDEEYFDQTKQYYFVILINNLNDCVTVNSISEGSKFPEIIMKFD